MSISFCSKPALFGFLATAKVLKTMFGKWSVDKDLQLPAFARKVVYSKHCFILLPGPLEKQ